MEKSGEKKWIKARNTMELIIKVTILVNETRIILKIIDNMESMQNNKLSGLSLDKLLYKTKLDFTKT